jgi:8-oxo-dGTP diphosphatase
MSYNNLMPTFPEPLPQVNLTVDVVIFTVAAGELQVLLIRRTNEPFAGAWALPGGYLQKNELSLDSAKRVLHEKAGVTDVYMEQLYTFDDPQRDPRGRHISIVYFALVPEDKLSIHLSHGTQEPTLISLAVLPELAFDHAEMITYARTRLQSKLEYSNVVYSLLPERFTMSALQSTYEAIIGRPLDKRNFQKKYASLGLIEPTSELTKGGKHRPARLYRFKDHTPTELKKFF